MARLRPGIRLEQVQADLTASSERLGRENPPSNEDWRARAVPLHTEVVGAYGPALVRGQGVAAIALAACYLPARRASEVDPIEALRA